MRARVKSLRPSRVISKIKTVKTALEKLDAERKMHLFKVRHYKPHVTFQFERGHFIVKTAENGADLEQCIKLRFNVFHKEYMKKKRTHGVDIDKLDYVCDHLMIFDKRTNQTIGTYRLNSSLHSDSFYSAAEFDLGKILELEGNKLELGRACIDKDFRTGVVIALLWRGIAEYIQRTDTKVLFGCGSIKTMEPMEIGLITKHFTENGQLTYDLNVSPTKKYKVKQLSKVLDYIDTHRYEYVPEDVEKLVPPLFQSYIRMGAKICGEPAIDRDFNCIDFLTVVKMDEMNPAIREKFKV
jgi:putative hemolysin